MSLLHDPDSQLNPEPSDTLTPAIKIVSKAGIWHFVHEYEHDPYADSYGQEAAEKLGIPAARVFKTLRVSTADKTLAVGIVPVSAMLNLKQLARALGVKKVTMADAADVERSTGYVLGGVSPIGQKKKLDTILDESALKFSSIHVSAGRRGLEIELNPVDLLSLTNARTAPIRQ